MDMMPEMDGFEATKKIRENPKWKTSHYCAYSKGQ
jgi:CheY-like chemotaxis protein